MARTRANILCDIWDDEDFVAMPVDAQRLYLFLLSQRDLSHAGLAPLRLRRWAKKVPGGTAGNISKALATLAKARFVVVDRDTEEVLVRTYVRNDGVYKQPKVMLRMREDARLMESDDLKAVFCDELQKIPLEALSDDPGGPNRDRESTRAIVARVIAELVMELGGNTLSDTLPDTHSEGYAIPPRGRAGALHLPPTTFHLPPGDSQVGGESHLSSEASKHPPQPCGKNHDPERNCGACANARRKAKDDEVAALKAKRAAEREANARAKAERDAEAERAKTEAEANPRAIEQAKAKARAAVKARKS